MSGATATDRSVVLDTIVVLTQTVATPSEAVEGSCRACCFGGGVVNVEKFATGEVDVFCGTGSSIADGLHRGVATLLLAVAVDDFVSAFALFFEAAVDFLLLIGRARLLIWQDKLKGVVAAVTAGQEVLYLVYWYCAIVVLLGASGCCFVVFDHPLATRDMCTIMACPDKRQTFPHIRPQNPISCLCRLVV